MKCPFCLEEDTVVKDSRPSDDGSFIRRRRYCAKCDSRFNTTERFQLRELFVFKKNGQKKIFDRDKMTRSILTATRKRSISTEQIELLVNNLIKKFESLVDSDLTTNKIGDEIMYALSKIDQVAYVRFASVYKDFHTARDFEKFIEHIQHDK